MGTAGTMKKKVSMSKKSKEPELQVYCRKCMKTKSSKEFLIANDLELDKNGYMSICRVCCKEIYDNSFAIERSLEKALLRTCKILNVAWIPNAVSSTKTHVDKMKAKGVSDSSVFGVYKSKLSTLSNLVGDSLLTFEEYPSAESLNISDDVTESEEDLVYIWGTGKSYEELTWLEKKYAKWIKNPNAEVEYNIEVLLRLICQKELEIRRKQQSNGNYDAESKALQELMKNTALTPLTQRASDVGNDSLCIGNIIKEMETKEPADVFEDQSLFKDYDHIEEKYINPYIVRSIKTFTTGIKDFDINYRGEENNLNQGDE
jgi:hypothetical protein